MVLGTWLQTPGLGQYEAAFRDDAIDDTDLPSLSSEDLKDLGVNLVGPRRKLLNAIAALGVDARADAALLEEVECVGIEYQPALNHEAQPASYRVRKHR